MNLNLKIAAAAILAASLAACGGGGGGGGGPIGPPTISPTSTPTPPPTTTTASGKVVDRDSNVALAGVTVAIAPWTAGATPIPEATTAPDGTFSFTAPNGHYLLYIGSNSTADTTRPTVHDNITLSGGVQPLHAPTPAPVSFITPPPSETSGNYRLTTLDPTNEVPCFNAFNTARGTNSLPLVVADEWLTENTRELNQWATGANRGSGSGTFLTTGNSQSSGGTSCDQSTIQPAFVPGANSYATNAQTLWFGGTWYTYNAGAQAHGVAEFPVDPRAFTDPNFPNWP